MRKVCIIIVNLNGKEFLKNCLDSIKKNTIYPNYEVVVVDNGSTDGSQGLVKSEYSWVSLVENKTNRGFSGGNNDGIFYAEKKFCPDYFYLLNNDTLVEKGWLSEAVDTVERNKEIGIVGSRQLSFERKPAVSAGWINMFGVKYYWGDKEKDVGWVSGAGFLVKRKVFETIGLFDEIYNPIYYEETDFESRAISSGFEIWHCPTSIFLHKGGGDSEKAQKKLCNFFFLRNRVRFFLRNKNLLYFTPRVFLDFLKL